MATCRGKYASGAERNKKASFIAFAIQEAFILMSLFNSPNPAGPDYVNTIKYKKSMNVNVIASNIPISENN